MQTDRARLTVRWDERWIASRHQVASRARIAWAAVRNDMRERLSKIRILV